MCVFVCKAVFPILIPEHTSTPLQCCLCQPVVETMLKFIADFVSNSFAAQDEFRSSSNRFNRPLHKFVIALYCRCPIVRIEVGSGEPYERNKQR